MTAAGDALTLQVAATAATSNAAGATIKGYKGLGIITPPAGIIMPPANPSVRDLLKYEASRAIAYQGQASSILRARKPAPGQFTGRLKLDLVLDTTSDVKWADNPNAAQATAVLNGVKAAVENMVRLPFDLTVKINVGWTRTAGIPMTGALGQSMYYITPAPRAALEAVFAKAPLNSLQRTAFAPDNLASFWPLLNGQDLDTTFGLAAMLGLAGWNDQGTWTYLANNLCGWIGLGNFNWDYSTDGSTNTTGGFSLWATIWHEIWEVLGRACGGYLGDLVAWAAEKLRNIVLGTGRRYVSTDGKVVVADYNQQAGGDYGDLAVGSDAFNAWTGPGLIPSRSPTLPGSAIDTIIITLLGIVLPPGVLAAEGIAP